VVAGGGSRGNSELLLDGYKLSVLHDEKSSGDDEGDC
jgi:hypothetical protein